MRKITTAMGTTLEHFIHQTEGRMRLRIPELKFNRNLRDKVLDSLSALNGVHQVATNKVSGSVTIHYDPGLLAADTLLGFIKGETLEQKSNVILFPTHRIHRRSEQPLPPEGSDDLLDMAMTLLSRKIIRLLLESALESTGQRIIRKIFL